MLIVDSVVHLLINDKGYDGSDVVCAYYDKEVAETEANRLNTLITNRPNFYFEKTAQEWRQATADKKLWEKAHGLPHDAEKYIVESVKIK